MVRRMVLISAVALVVMFSAAQEIRKTAAHYTAPNSGGEMYTAYCASCHGMDGKGQGPAAAALKTTLPDLTQMAKRNGGVYPELHVYAVIKGDEMMAAHGSPDMPVWGPVFRSLDQRDVADVHMRLANLTHYLETLQEK